MFREREKLQGPSCPPFWPPRTDRLLEEGYEGEKLTSIHFPQPHISWSE